MGPNGGLFRRSIVLRRLDREHVTGSVQDDFHHFVVRVAHRDGVVRAIDAESVRAPWSTCPAAAFPLKKLVGATVFERASDIGLLIDMRAQCTHLFDLAGLLIALAWRGDAGLVYDGYVRAEGATINARLDRDGKAVLHWEIADNSIVGAADRAEEAPMSLARGFRAWTETLPTSRAEHALVLRRTIFVSRGRRQRLDEGASPDDLRLPADVCYSLGSVIRQTAVRTKGMRIDFAATAAAAGD